MTIDASRLQVSVQEQERWRRRMSVTVPAAIVQDEERKAAKQLASRARLKGFRKGKVPTRVIESRFAGALRQEALDKLIGDAYRQALAAEQLRPISEGQVEDVRYEPQQDLSFFVAFDVQPVIDLGRLGGFSVERPASEVTSDSRTPRPGRPVPTTSSSARATRSRTSRRPSRRSRPVRRASSTSASPAAAVRSSA
jgi:FKBP-type peptidyl-prolyl cis-trans isomerase (trigger factor)